MCALKKPKTEKIRVLFIVSEIAKWKEQSLYEAMDNSGEFEPIVGLSAWNKQAHLSAEALKKEHERAAKFFDSLGVRYVRTVTTKGDKKVFHDLSAFSPDIVFYTEQWAPCVKQDPYEVSRFALTYFLPYYVPDFGILFYDCFQRVERLSETYFCLNESWAEAYRKAMSATAHSCRYVATGHPALDPLKGKPSIPFDKRYIIYAPHFTFPRKDNAKGGYVIGTFDWNGLAILEYAEKHPRLPWVFKPHPILKEALVKSGMMNERNVADYYERWAKLGLVSTDSNYKDLFVNSRVMITDSASFLPEYGSTGHPLIRLVSSHFKHVAPDPAQRAYDSYYCVRNLDEMLAAFKLVIEDGQDPKMSERVAAILEAGLLDGNATQNIVDYTLGVFGRKMI